MIPAIFRGSAGLMAALFALLVSVLAYAIVAPLAPYTIVICAGCVVFTAYNWHSVVGTMASIAASQARIDALDEKIAALKRTKP